MIGGVTTTTGEFRRGVRLALDWGDARIGVAACDRDGVLAFPIDTVKAGPDELARILALIEEYAPLEVIVGFPRSLGGGEGPAAVKAQQRAAGLAARTRVAVRLVDERLSTVSASRRLQSAGKRSKQQRGVIDAAAATEILEHALALERSRGTQFGALVSGGPDDPGAPSS